MPLNDQVEKPSQHAAGAQEIPARPRIAFSDVTFAYDEGAILAIDHLSFSVEGGESVAIIGPSGCGKSTLLHLAAGLMKPTAGTVTVGGEQIGAPRMGTSFIPQDLGLFPWKTVAQNVALGLAIRKFPKQEVRERTEAAIAQVGLAGFGSKFPKELSGGMRQRIALARAIALDMDVLLMDEPLSAIDALLRETLQDVLLDLWKKRAHTQMLVTHSIEEAVYLGQRIVVLTARPSRLVTCISNPRMGEPDYRDSQEFTDTCHAVRAALSAGSSSDASQEAAS